MTPLLLETTSTPLQWWQTVTGLLGIPGAVIALVVAFTQIQKMHVDMKKTKAETAKLNKDLSDQKQANEQNREYIQTISLLARAVFTKYELEILHKLSKGESITTDTANKIYYDGFKQAILHLRGVGFIENKGKSGFSALEQSGGVYIAHRLLASLGILDGAETKKGRVVIEAELLYGSLRDSAACDDSRLRLGVLLRVPVSTGSVFGNVGDLRVEKPRRGSVNHDGRARPVDLGLPERMERHGAEQRHGRCNDDPPASNCEVPHRAQVDTRRTRNEVHPAPSRKTAAFARGSSPRVPRCV